MHINRPSYLLAGLLLLAVALPALAADVQSANKGSKGVSGAAATLDMGEIKLNSALGEPLNAQIELVASGKVEKDSLSARLASPELFESMGISYPGKLPNLEFRIETRTNGESLIKVTSAEPVNEPVINLLVQLNGSSGRLIREYTLLPQKTADASSVSQTEMAPDQTPPEIGNTAPFRIERFLVKGNTLLDVGLVERLLAPYKGESRGYSDIQRALEALEGAYRSAGYSAVHVNTPEQDVTDGIVTFQVVESMVGKVILGGNEFYDKTNIRNALPALAEGYTPNARELSENLRLANENLTRQIEVVLALGDEENTVDAQVNVKDSSPRKIFLTLDNTGNQSTGMYRTGVGLQHNNLFNRDQAATLNYITSPNHTKDVTQLSASYRIPFYSIGDSVDLIAAYSDTNAGTTTTVAGPLTFSGKGHIYSAHYNRYLPRKGEYAAKVIGGIDYRAYLNTCLINGADVCGGSGKDVTVHPISVTYNGTLTKPSHVADYSASVARNIPGGTRGGSADFSAVRPSPTGGAGAKANYTLLRLNGSVAGNMPRGWQYRLAGNTQYTRDALIPGESFGLVGANAVRGFIERELNSDKGYVLNAEIYTPDLASKGNLQNASFRLLGFIDHASGWNEPLAGESTSRTSVGSAGAGLRFTYGKNLTAKLDVARVTHAGASITTKVGDKRGHIGLMATW